MRPLIIALLITVAAMLAVLLVGAPTGFAVGKFNDVSVSGTHPLIKPSTFSPNGDGEADTIIVHAKSGSPTICGSGKTAVVGIAPTTTGACTAAGIGNYTVKVTGPKCIPYCTLDITVKWDGTNPTTKQKYPDGTYCIKSGCYDSAKDANSASADKIIEIKMNSKLYPSLANYQASGGPACGMKPKCSLQTGFGGWGTGCGKTATQNAAAWCKSGDTCLAQDNGSCKANKGWAGNVESCDPVSGIGICQSK